jgi:oligopeptide transport system ATP-binding protein
VKHQGKSKSEAKKMAIELMGRTGIPDAAERYGDYPFEYSGGMRQRIVIAIALACHPKILICDEPTTALDVTTQAQILDLIRDLKEEYHFSIIFITHDLGVVASIADRIAVMYSGRLIEVGTVDEIFYDPRHPYTWSLLSSLPQLATKDTNLYSIPGTPPSLYSEIKGDAFAPRDPYALKVDFEREPPLFKITDTHYARTWLLDPRAPKIEKPEIIQNLHERIEKQMESDFMKRAETEGEVNAS